MSERIQELAKQAGLKKDHASDREYIGDFDWRQFAELIVKECLDIVNRKEYSYHEADPLWETAQLIKEHFGVEK
jgi:hypothetical protein